jgi:hypothetical protein
MVGGAVVLTTGADEKRHVVIPDTDFHSGRGRDEVFQ